MPQLVLARVGLEGETCQRTGLGENGQRANELHSAITATDVLMRT